MGADEGSPVESWPLTGRDEELDFVLSALHAPSSGGVLLAGPAGVGKSRLAREALAAADATGSATVAVTATQAMASIPFGAVAGVIGDDAPRGRTRLELFQVVCRRLVEQAGTRPLVVGVDDGHRLDDGSAALVMHLVVAGAARVVMTVRSREPTPDAVTALWKEGHVQRLDLVPLAPVEVVAMAEAHLGGWLDHRTRRWLTSSSDGRPLYVRELLKGAVDSGDLQAVQGVWRLERPAGLSPRLVELIEGNLGDLDAEERRAMAAIALAEPVDRVVLARLVDATAVERLERRGLIVVSGGPALQARCAHPLYGEAVITQLGEQASRALRGDLGRALRESGGLTRGDALRLATWQMEAGDPGDPELLTSAAREAIARFDYALAVRLAQGALDAGAGIRAAMALSSAAASLGDYDEGERALEPWEGRAHDEQEATVYLLHRSRNLHWALDRVADAQRLLDRAATWWDTASWQRTIAGLRTAHLREEGRYTEAIAGGLPLLQAPDLGDDARQVVIGDVGVSLVMQGRTREAQAIADDAIAGVTESAAASGRAGPWAVIEAWLEARLRGGRDWDAADTLVDELRRASDDVSIVSAMLRWAQGRMALERGAAAAARHHFEETAFLAEAAGYPVPLLVTALAGLAQAEALCGDPTAAAAALDRAAQLWSGRPWRARNAEQVAMAEVWAAASAGTTSRAAEIGLVAAGQQGENVLGEAALLHAAVLVGAPPAEADDRLAAIAATTDSEMTAAQAAHVSALCRQDADALDAAGAAFARIGAALQASRAYADAAEIHRDAGRVMSSRSSAAHSSRLLEHCKGAVVPWSARTEEVRLSAREREVAGLAARGLTNQEIAERLHVSVRTVESHLYRASVKAGVSRREDFAALLE